MQDYENYFESNKSLWDLKTEIHEQSKFYDVNTFIKTSNSLNKIELKLINSVENKSILHLQCHFGMDSISLAHLGAEVTAVDFSPKSIELAKQLSKQLNIPVNFIEANVYDVSSIISQTFDMVFVSYGAICWLPDLDKWAEIVSSRLKKGGELVLIEFHPTLYMFDFPTKKIAYHYFNRGVYAETTEKSYTDGIQALSHKEYFWNHPLSEVFSALLAQNMSLSHFEEYDFCPYNCFENMVERKKNEFVYGGFPVSLPHTYSIRMVKK